LIVKEGKECKELKTVEGMTEDGDEEKKKFSQRS
jgi:hypothetical protein